MNALIRWRRLPLVGRFVHQILGLWGLEIPSSVVIGEGSRVVHHGYGVIVHPNVRIGKRVRIFPGVVIGRFDAEITPSSQSSFEAIEIGDDVIVYPGAKIIGGPGVTRIASGTRVGPNAVVIGGTSEGGTWVGIPARRVG